MPASTTARNSLSESGSIGGMEGGFSRKTRPQCT
ncbi:protein of unknown function (plasmid) [Caballeronia sp. S22]